MDRLQTNDHSRPPALGEPKCRFRRMGKRKTRDPFAFHPNSHSQSFTVFRGRGNYSEKITTSEQIRKEENREGSEACSCKSAHANSAAGHGTRMRGKIPACLMS